MRPDSEIKLNVENELQADPDIRSDDIAVDVKEGIVTLVGFVQSYRQKRQTEAAAKRIAGVMAVANDLAVRLPIVYERPDPEVARDLARALRSQLDYGAHCVRAIVKSGWVILRRIPGRAVGGGTRCMGRVRRDQGGQSAYPQHMTPRPTGCMALIGKAAWANIVCPAVLISLADAAIPG